VIYLRWLKLAVGITFIFGSSNISLANELLEQALRNYKQCAFELALEQFQNLLKLKELTPDEKKIAHQYSAFCLILLNHKAKAVAEFKKLLSLDKTVILDPELYPPKIIKVFNQAKQEFIKEKQATALKKELLPIIPEKVSEPKLSLPAVKKVKPNILFNFLPLGIPQFKQRKFGKGIVVLSLEFILGVSSFVAYQNQQALKIKRDNWDERWGEYIDVRKAEQYQMLQRATAILFLITYLYSVIDAF
jgi:tetratricopeptide (TPR) repeat protein